MNPADLAAMLELMAHALRALPSGQGNLAVPAVPAVPAAAPAPAGEQHTLLDWLKVYEGLLTERGYKAQTIKNRTAHLAHVKRLWGNTPVRTLRPHAVSAALKEFLPARSSTAQRVLAELRDVYTEAIANDWADINPAAHVKMPVHKVKRARLAFSVWQAMRTLSTTSPQLWVESMLLLAIATGQRHADLAKMRFDDIVADENGEQYLRVEQQKQARKGYGARVEIPLSLRLDVIGMTVGDVIEHCRHSALPGPTLLRKAGGGSIEESSLSARFHEHIRAVLGDAAHAPHEWPSLHEVRSLSARCYTEQGVDVQTLMGHKHAEMTAMYVDDRGLSAAQWKRVKGATVQPVQDPAC